MNGRPNRRKKANKSNSSDILWTGFQFGAIFSKFNICFPLIPSVEEPSTASQLVEYVLDWMSTRHENSKFTQAREFLHSKMFGRIKMAAISLSFLVTLIVIIVCTVKWFGIKITKQEPIHCETGKLF